MNPEEAEFLAEDKLIEIIPAFNHNVIHLISGDVGPFKARLPVRVPLWMAVNLKQQGKCRIQPPEWMDVVYLEELKEQEKLSRNFVKMPSNHYMEETKVLLSCAPDDIARVDEIRTIVKDIWDMRMSKLRSSVDVLVKNGHSYAAVDNLTLMEINSVRPLLPLAMDHVYQMKKSKTESEGSSFSRTLPIFSGSHPGTPK